MNDWQTIENRLVKEFEFKNFASAMRFVNKAAKIAEFFRHHPDILIHSYRKVKIMLYSHDEGAVTKKDLELAKAIDKINLEK